MSILGDMTNDTAEYRTQLVADLEESAGQAEREAAALEANAGELREEARRARAAVRALKE